MSEAKFIRIGGKVFEIDRYTEIDGKQVPVIKAVSEVTEHPDGRRDVTVKVPCLSMDGEAKQFN